LDGTGTTFELKWTGDQKRSTKSYRSAAKESVASLQQLGDLPAFKAEITNGVPFYVALPSPTIDFSIDGGIAQIPIERRSADEVATMTGRTADGRIETIGVVSDGSSVANHGDRTDHRARRLAARARRAGAGLSGAGRAAEAD
jgi:hypothetical protein